MPQQQAKTGMLSAAVRAHQQKQLDGDGFRAQKVRSFFHFYLFDFYGDSSLLLGCG